MASAEHRLKLMSHLPQTFFGLSEEYQENLYEEFFLLKYHGGWSFIEAYNLPVALRRWWIDRLAKQFEEEHQQMQKAKNSSR